MDRFALPIILIFFLFAKVDLGGVQVSYSPIDHEGPQFVELTIIGKNGVIWR